MIRMETLIHVEHPLDSNLVYVVLRDISTSEANWWTYNKTTGVFESIPAPEDPYAPTT